MLRSFIAGAVFKPVTTTMVTVAVLLFGLVAATRLPVELLPDLAYPTITVQTEDPDAAPAEVEELVTRPIEERVGAVPGVVRVESVSREGRSEVILDFAWGTRIDQAMADVREKLDRVDLPTTASRPIVLRYDPSAEPIMRLALRPVPDADRTRDVSPADLAVLREAADETVKRELEKLAGVAAVEIHGGEEEEILVELDPDRLSALGITSDQVVAALQADNVNRPGGAITQRDDRYLIRTLHESVTPSELGEVIVRSSEGAELRLRDIADVRRAPREREELSLVGGVEAVELAVYREGDANIVAAAKRVQAALPGLPLAPGHEVVVLSNQAEFIESAIEEVRDATLMGGLLAIAVLLFFLRDLRSTVVIAVAIPISLLATFVPMSALGVSLNIMSLGGLALGVGMLVDNSIVVLEAIARVRERDERDEQGRPATQRSVAIDGTAEVASSVVASTLTTIAVFFPMSFVQGVAGQLVRDLSYAVSFSMLSSMLVSLTLVPVLVSVGDERSSEQRADDPTPRSWILYLTTWPIALLAKLMGAVIYGIGLVLGLLARPFTAAYEALERRYSPVLRFALRHRALILIASVLVCALSLRLAGRNGTTLVPEIEQSEFFVQIAAPQGTSLERTAAVVERLSSTLDGRDEVRMHFARVGSITQAGSASGGVQGPHLAQINVQLEPGVVNQAAVEQHLLERMREVNPEPEARLELGHPSLLSFGPPLEIQVFSEELERAVDHTKRLLPELRELESLADVVPDDLQGRPEVRIQMDRERLGRLGMTVDDAASAVARSIQGEIATTLYAADRQLDVRVQLPRVDRSNVEDVGRIQIAVVDGVPVPLSAVASVEPALGPSEIRRIDGRRGLRMRARTSSVDLQGVAADVQTVLDRHATDDPRVQATVAGQAGEMGGSLESLLLTAALSVFLVYVVMASSFESLLHPFLIMFTVPLAIAGVALAMFIAGLPLSAMVGIGVIVLGGIVVNNAIVLVNAVNDRRGAGMPVNEALVDAGQLRVRPILMTTLTTILGLVPMAMGLGDGASLRQPLAIAVIGGLGLSTLLTLLVIPCVYSLFPGRARDAWTPK